MGESPQNEDDGSLPGAAALAENVLLLASAETDPGRHACFDLLNDRPPSETNIIVISPTISPDAWLEEWDDAHPGTRPNQLGFVAIGDLARGEVAVAQSTTQLPTPVEVKPVKHPGNLTDIGVAVTYFLSAWDEMNSSVTICLRSLDTLLRHSELESVFRFLHVMTGKMQTSGNHFHAHLDAAKIDSETRFTLLALFDVAIEQGPEDEWDVSGYRQSVDSS